MALASTIGRTASAACVVLVVAACATQPASPSQVVASSVATPSVLGPSRPAPTPTPSPTPTASIGSGPVRTWQSIGTIPTGGTLFGLTATDAGYVLLEGPRTVSFSSDGHAWQRTVLPFDERTSATGIPIGAHANAIATNGSSFIVLGAFETEPCSEQGDGGPPPCLVQPIAWTSRDGLHWQSSLPNVMPADASGKPERGEFTGAWWDGTAWMAAVELRESVEYKGNSLVRSTDGLHWTRVPPPPHFAGVPRAQLPNAHGGLLEGAGVSVVWQDWDLMAGDPTATLARFDGTAWTTPKGFDGAHSIVRLGIGPLGPAQPWVLAGTVQVAGAGDSPRLWISNPDGGFITRTPTVDVPGTTPVITSLAHGDGFVAVGLLGGQGGGGVTWTSGYGTTWEQVPDPGLAGQALYELFVAKGPAGLLLVGSTGEDSRVWSQ